MGSTEQGKEQKKSTAALLGRLSIGIFTVSLLGDTQWLTITLIIFGVILALSGIYLRVPCNLKQEWFLCKVADERTMSNLEAFSWLCILALFGIKLIQTGMMWLKIIGILFAIFAYIVLVVSIWRTGKKQELSIK